MMFDAWVVPCVLPSPTHGKHLSYVILYLRWPQLGRASLECCPVALFVLLR